MISNFRASKTGEVLERKNKKLSRSLTFSSLLPISARKGKLRISKFEGDRKLKAVEENSELTSFCDSLKRNTTLKDKLLNKDTVTETSMRRLSLVCDEIDKFEREFVDPLRLTASSLSLAASSASSARARPRTTVAKHRSCAGSMSRLQEMNAKYFSSDSVTSGYDSGAFSRESTPDLSLTSSLTDTSEPPPSLPRNPPPTEDAENNSLAAEIATPRLLPCEAAPPSVCSEAAQLPNLLSSTPRKAARSQSERLPARCGPLVRRSHTTTATSSRLPATVSRAGCSADCGARVTVNGFCYH